MKKRFLPFSLLLVIMIFGQSVMTGQVGHYVPRAKENSSAEAYLHSLRANQHTGMIDPAWLIAANKQVESSTKDYADIIYWKSMGPDNMGGRTTAVIYNNQNTNEAYIGSMGGGVFYTWNKGISWHQVGENLMVSCMAQDEDGTFYVGTGDHGVAYDYNGLADYGYENSFIGSGLYKIENKVMTRVEGTNPLDNNDPAGEWAYINDVVVDGKTVIVATNAGVKYLKDGNWMYAKVGDDNLTGVAEEVKVGSDHKVVASVDGKIYIGSLDNMVCKSSDNSNDEEENGVIVKIGTAAGLLDIAIAPSDPNRIYAANIKDNGNHVKFYSSEDQGETWNIILPTVTATLGHQIYEDKGLYYHGLVVAPNNPDCLYVTAYNLWVLNRANAGSTGYYQAMQLTSAGAIHLGINGFAFSPREVNTAYVATDGGIFKATKADDIYFNFLNCNRGYISTRCLSVAPSGKLTRVVGGLIDHGPILINGLEGTNNMETGDLLLPAITGAHYGSFDESYIAASCAVSVISPDAFFLSTIDGGFQRTFNAGVDYDESNFMTSFNYTGYRLPMAYWECFDDEYTVEEVMFKCKQNQKAGDVVICYSNSGDYPFEYTLTEDMHYNEEHPALSDSIFVHDPISTKLFVAGKVNTNDKFYSVYYTLDAMHATRTAEWYNVIVTTDSVANPTCMTMSKDGDNLFVGTADNKIVRVSNLRQAVDAYTASADSAEFVCVVKNIALPIDGQVVTSVAVYPDDANKIVVTLGNYGNESYVLYCDNALSDNPTFTVKQGNLPAMPVYSSVYTSTYDGANNGHVLIGTDHGVFRTTDITASSPVWTLESDNMGDVPVLDLKQQILYQEDMVVTTIVDDSIPEMITYPGTNNEGVIYAATYGRGLFRCETYRQNSGNSVPETPVVAAESNVSMYPNPVRDDAKVCFELNSKATVSYQVYDLSGRMVKTETLGNYAEGKYEVNVSMNGLAKGTYVLRLNAGSHASSLKFMVL